MAGNGASRAAAVMPAPFDRTSLPGRIVFADGAETRLADELDRCGLHQAMLITASRDAQLGEYGHRALGSRVTAHWEEVRQHVPRELARRATGCARAAGADVLVAVGGGSTTGLAKAIAVDTSLPIAVVPTTYAGSEMTPIYGLTSDNDKITARDARALPQIVVYDPQLLTTLPAAVVGPSGLNALAHCAEALWAAGHDPITDAIALDGARRLRQHLRAAYATDDPAARGEVLIAACLAGTALGTAGTSLHHALCHLLGGMFDAPHAETHAVMIPYMVRYLQPAVPEAARRLAQAMDVSESALAADIWELGQSVGTPAGLRSIGIIEDDLPKLVAAALARRLQSPRSLEHDSLYEAVQAAWTGQAPSAA
jgi:maleylacetate reductase